MRFQQLLDSVSLGGVFVAFVLLALLTAELGYRVGRWWQARSSDEKKGPTDMIVGSLLALVAFLLAITTGMASERFDARRSLVLAEANAIGTTYLRAGYLPEPAPSEIRSLLREYVDLRIVPNDPEEVRARIARSVELQYAMWAIAEDVARTDGSDVVALFIESLNGMIDLHESRVTAGIYARVPVTVILLLLSGSVVTMVMVGYAGGLEEKRASPTAIVLVLMLGAVITLVVDLDRPQGGFLTVSQQALVDVQQQIESAAGQGLPEPAGANAPIGPGNTTGLSNPPSDTLATPKM